MAQIGRMNRLDVTRETPQGFYLDDGAGGEILLPYPSAPKDAAIGSTVNVFVYFDSEDRIIATSRHPKAMVGEFACLKVVGVNRHVGCFLDWGLEKDLLLPFREQSEPLSEGDPVVVYLFVDSWQGSERIAASSKLDRHFSEDLPDYEPKEKVDLLVYDQTPMGYKAIINNTHTGMLYKSELSGPLDYGQRLEGYIKAVRPDQKIDLLRDPSGYKRVLPLSEEIFDALLDAGGHLPYHDKTPPEIIREAFGCSKKAFKQAIGGLYKQKRIDIEPESGIRLVRE